MKLFLLLFVVVFSFVLTENAKGASMIEPLKKSGQIIVVNAESWNSAKAVMTLYEKKDGSWQVIKHEIPVILGKKGLGWGRSFGVDYGQIDKNAPVKKEGDGKSPAGIFEIKQAFGFDKKSPSVKLPYIRLTRTIECVDDERSSQYNRIVDNSAVPVVDWKSSEKMSEIGLYKTGIVIGHNADPVEKGCGSCIFFHIWETPEKGTSGCTAMAEDDLSFLLQWIDPSKNPLLLQFTGDVYDRIKSSLSLP